MKRKIRKDGWYIRKSFPHFDLPLNFDEAQVRVQDPAFVAKKAFWPFIGFIDTKRRFKKIAGKTVVKNKERPLRYCSHHDGYIHSYYASLLTERYESEIRNVKIDHAVLGYRKGVGTNIHMAKAAFDEIVKRGSCSVIALDIESFFDNIDHTVLKRTLCQVLGVSTLSNDWFAIFKSMTRYSWVDIQELSKRLGFKLKDPPRPICSAQDFRSKVRGDDGSAASILETNPKRWGIPQGSPISAVFSNVSMLEFDQRCVDYFSKKGSSYRRYSDDILIISNSGDEAEHIKSVEGMMKCLGGAIKLSKDKTDIAIFETNSDGTLKCDKPISYLGFTFDGKRITLRGRTLSRYYRRMSYAARHTANAATKGGSGKVYRRKIYRDLSHLGSQNFYTYAKSAAEILDDEAPKRQLRKHFRILDRKLNRDGR